MLKTLCLRIPALIALSAAGLFATAVTGKWSGSVTLDKKDYPIHAEFHQTGSHITGHLVADEDKKPVSVHGSVAGNRVRLYGSLDSENVRFDLTLVGDKLTGKAWDKHGDQAEQGPIQVSLHRLNTARTGLTGDWSATVLIKKRGRAEHLTLHLIRKGGAVTGYGSTADQQIAISSGLVKGNSIVFFLETPNGKFRFDLTLTGNKLTGKVFHVSGDPDDTANFTAVREG